MYEFFKRTSKFDEKKASVNGNKEVEKNAAKMTTDDNFENAE